MMMEQLINQNLINLIFDNIYFVMLLLSAALTLNNPPVRLLVILLTAQSSIDSLLTWMLLAYGGEIRGLIWFPSFIATEMLFIVAIYYKTENLNLKIRADMHMIRLSLILISFHFLGFLFKNIIIYEPLWLQQTYQYGTQTAAWLQLALIAFTISAARFRKDLDVKDAIKC